MTDLLDTNTYIRLLSDDRNAPVPRRLAILQAEEIRLCSVVKAELYLEPTEVQGGSRI